MYKPDPRWWLVFVFIVVVVAGSVSGGWGDDAGQEIHVGSELHFPPYATVDSQGQPAGFSVDLIKAVAETMGMRVRFSTGSWDEVWNGLVKGEVEVLPIVAKLPERARLVDFSLPHTETFDAFFVRHGSPVFKDLASAGGREIVVMRSDAAHHALLEHGFKGKIFLVDSIPQGLRLVSSGRHDAFLCSKLIGALAVREQGIKDLTVGPPIPDYKRTFSFAVRKGDEALLEKLNQGLLIIKTNGEYEHIYRKWLLADDPWRRMEKYVLPAVFVIVSLGSAAAAGLIILKRLVNKRTRELAESNEALRRTGDELEERVASRTAELVRSNEALEKEIAERRQAEESLRESEQRLQQALRVSRSFTFEWKPALDQVIRSDSCAVILGLTGSEAVCDSGSRFFQRVHPADRERIVGMLGSLTPDQNTYATEYRVMRGDGSIAVLEEHAQATFDSAGTLEKLFGVSTDITGHRRTEEALRLTQASIDVAAEMVCWFTPDGRVRYANEAICRMLGYSREELMSMTALDFSPGFTWEQYAGHWEEVRRRKSFTQEVIHRRKDGSEFPAEVLVNHVVYGGEEYIFAYGREITRRKQAEERARREHEEIELANRILHVFVEYEGDELFDRALTVVLEGMASQHGVFGFIAEPGHLTCPSLSKMLDECEVEGKCIHYPPEKWNGLWAQALIEKRSLYANEPPPVPPGHPIIHNNLAAPILFRGKAIGLLNLANREGGYEEHDRERLDSIADRIAPVLYAWIERKLREDERKRAEEALMASLREKEVLLKEIHHRVKNNLQVISSLVNLQVSGVKDEMVREVLKDVTDRIRSMALVHEKLYHSADLARINFADYAESLLNALWGSHGAIASSIRLRFDMEPVHLPVDTAVPCGLILNELAGNSLKHAFKGKRGGEVTVSLHPDSEGRISLCVRDNGVGMPEGFDWRNASSLGLRLVQMLAKQIKADVEVDNVEGTGFNLVLRHRNEC